MKCMKNSINVFKKQKYLEKVGNLMGKKFLKVNLNTFCEKNDNYTNSNNQSQSEEINNGDNTKYPEIIKCFFEKNIKNKKLPCFEVYSSQIEILNQPFDFYLAIIVKKIEIYFSYF
jgi:hypothetical protein